MALAQYGTLITTIGLAQIANAQITQSKVGLEYIALGDGNGAHYVPTQNQTALVHEVWRGPIAELSIDPTNSNRIIVDAVIPVTAGGFTIREIGIFDENNRLIAIGQYPEKYKPQLSEGVSEETLIHFVIETNNADVVKLNIDPTVIIASRKYVDEKVAGINNGLTQITQKTTKLDTEFTKHLDESVASEEGVHGLRYFKGELARENGTTWEKIETGGKKVYYDAVSTDGLLYTVTIPDVTSLAEGDVFHIITKTSGKGWNQGGVKIKINNLPEYNLLINNVMPLTLGLLRDDTRYSIYFSMNSRFVMEGAMVGLIDRVDSTTVVAAATANAVKMVNDKIKPDWVNITDVIAPFQSLNPTNVRMRKTAGIASIDFQLTLSAATVANTQYTLFNLPQGYDPGNVGVFQITYDAVNPVYINARILPLGAVVIKHNAVIPKTTLLTGNVTYATREVLT